MRHCATANWLLLQSFGRVLADFSFRVGNCSLGCRTRSLTFCALNVLDQKSSAADTVGSRAWPTYQECHGQPCYLNLHTPKWQAPTELPTKLAHTTQTESWRPFSFMNKSGGLLLNSSVKLVTSLFSWGLLVNSSVKSVTSLSSCWYSVFSCSKASNRQQAQNRVK